MCKNGAAANFIWKLSGLRQAADISSAQAETTVNSSVVMLHCLGHMVEL